MSRQEVPDQTPKWKWFGVLGLIAALIVLSGYTYYRHEFTEIRQSRYEDLKAIADLKANDISSWRDERLHDASMNSTGRIRTHGLNWLNDPGNVSLKDALQEDLQFFQDQEGYENIIIAGVDGSTLLSLDSRLTELEPEAKSLVTQAVSAPGPVIGDFYSCEGCNKVHLDVAAPLRGADGRPAAVLILRSDPEKYLYPLIESWPMPSNSAETQLVRREGDYVLHLTPLRFQHGAALNRKMPLTETSAPAVQAAMGTTGMYEGTDYRGVEVLADIRPVPETPWFLVTKVDADEILSDVRYSGMITLLFVGLFIVMTGTLAAFIASSRRKNLYMNLFKAEQELKPQQKLLLAISSGQLSFIAGNSDQAAFDDLLASLLDITESEYGFIGEVLFTTEGKPYLKAHAITNIAWNEETRSFYEAHAPEGMEFLNLKTLFGEALVSEAVVISNDPAGDPRKGGLPEGHPALNAFLGIPIKAGGKLVAMVGLANRPGGYDLELAEYLQPLLATIGQLVEAWRNEKNRKQAEASLQDALTRTEDEKEKNRAIIEGIGDGVSIQDTGFRVLFQNQVHKDMIGDHLGEVCHEAYEKQDSTCDGCPVAMAFSDGKVHLSERKVEFPEGIRYFEITASPIRNAEGQIVAGAEAVREVTDRKRSEEEKENLRAQLLQAQKMEAVGRLAGGVAHDFNNMLGVILGYAQLSIMDTTAGEKLHGNLQEIIKAARRSTDLTRQLLAFARRQNIDPRVMDLNEVTAGMLNMLQRLIGEDIKLVWKPGPNLPNVKMDPAQVDQLLVNLTVNARDAIDSVGVMTIETEDVVFDEAYCRDHTGFVPGNYVMLAVSDDGRGISMEDIDQIFEPFFTTKETGKGTGLGLATVYGIVKQNKGFINVYSEPAQGTTFRIYLPVEPGEEAAPAPAREKLALGGSETVLIVEDEEEILNISRTVLEKAGYTTLGASDPTEALRLAGEYQGTIDLLVTDVIMPVMNGKDLRDRLIVLRPGIRVLFMSGYTADVIAERGVLEAGVNFLQKPFSVNTLAARVREVLDR